MKCKVNNWMVLSVSNNKSFVNRGYYITKKFFPTYEDAREFMLEESEKYAKAKEKDFDKNEVLIDCGEYFVEIQIIDCSKDIKIIGIE